MLKKLSSFLGIIIGVALAVVGFWLKPKLGAISWALTGAGIFVFLVCLVRLLWLFKKPRNSSVNDSVSPETKELPEYRRKKTLLSRAEWEFLQTLKGMLPADKFEIDVQVPLVAVIDKITQNSYRNELFRVVDYCVVDSVSYAPLLLIELNDASHTRADRIERDRKVREICERAKMPLIGFEPSEARDTAAVRRAIFKNMLKK